MRPVERQFLLTESNVNRDEQLAWVIAKVVKWVYWASAIGAGVHVGSTV